MGVGRACWEYRVCVMTCVLPVYVLTYALVLRFETCNKTSIMIRHVIDRISFSCAIYVIRPIRVLTDCYMMAVLLMLI